MRPQKAQTAQNADRLDEVIDHIAARLTNVAEDEGLASRIVQALPERSPWLPYGWVTRFAVGALATLAIVVVLRPFSERSTDVLRTESSPVVSSPIVELPSNDRRTPVEPQLIVRRTIVGPSLNVRRTTGDADRPDHERRLAAVAAPDALILGSLGPVALPEDAPLTIESLEIASLPLTESFSPR